LIWIGEPIQVKQGWERTPDEWTTVLEGRLRRAQDALADCSVGRDTNRLQTVLRGRSGVGRPYDAWRSIRARLRGERFNPEHGRQ